MCLNAAWLKVIANTSLAHRRALCLWKDFANSGISDRIQIITDLTYSPRSGSNFLQRHFNAAAWVLIWRHCVAQISVSCGAHNYGWFEHGLRRWGALPPGSLWWRHRPLPAPRQPLVVCQRVIWHQFKALTVFPGLEAGNISTRFKTYLCIFLIIRTYIYNSGCFKEKHVWETLMITPFVCHSISLVIFWKAPHPYVKTHVKQSTNLQRSNFW